MKRKEVNLAKARVAAYRRVAEDRTQVATGLADRTTKDKLRLAAKPPSPSKGLKKAGAVLLLTPDPITAIPGVALVGVGHLAKAREPLGVDAVLKETKKLIRDLQEFV